MAFCLLFSFVSAEDIGQKIEDLELNLEIQQILIDTADSQGKDVSNLRSLVEDFENRIDDLRDAYREHGEGVETQRAQNAVWQVLIQINEEYERLGIDLDREEDSDAKEKVEEAIDGLDVHLEILDALLDAAEAQGKSVGRAKAELENVRKLYGNMVDHYENGDYEEAQRELFRIYIAMPDLQEELEKLGIGEEEDNRSLEEKVEDVLTKFEYPLQVIDIVLDAAEAEGKDVDTVRETLDEMKDILEEVQEFYDAGNYKDAWTKVMRLFVLGVRLQNDLRDAGIDLDDDRTSEEKVREALEEFEVHEESIEFVFTQAEKKGRDTSRARSLFEELKSLMREVKDLYDDGKYEEAEMKMFQVYLKAPAFQEEFQKVVKSLEETPEEMRAKLEKTLGEYHANLPLIEQMIDAAERQGKDVSAIRRLLGEFKGYMGEVEDLYDAGEYKDALRKLQRAYIIANSFKKEFEALQEIDTTEIRENIEKASEGIAFAKDLLRELRRAGIDTSEAEALVEKIEARMYEVKEHYDAGEYREASKELMRAYSFGAKLQAISEELIKEYKGEN